MQTTANVKHNIIANSVAKAWLALMALAFLPLYIRFLGIEAYGLIGIYVSLMALFSVLDLGLGITLSKELARLSARSGTIQEARDLVRTFELIYWMIGIMIGVVIAIAAHFIARYWLIAQGVALGTVEDAITVMGLAVALQWPAALYSGGLIGLQRQIPLNIIRIGASTLQAGGAVLILWLVSPTILAFFFWHILASVMQTVVLAWYLWKSLPSAIPAAFRKTLLFKNWRFAGGMTGIAFLVTILTQADKVVLSKMLPLETFGYYSLAAIIAGALTAYISYPIFTTLFPRFSQAVSIGNTSELELLYHKGCQLVALLIVPLGTFTALFSKELLSIWFGDGRLVSETYLLAALLIVGTSLNGVMTLPYALQLSHGWTRLSFFKNVISVVLVIPLLLWLVMHFGAVGAAVAWIALNLGYFLFEIPLMHRRILKKSMWRWYIIDAGLPAVLCLGLGIAARLLMPSGLAAYAVLLWISSGFALAFICTGIAMPHTRTWMRQFAFNGAGARAVF